MTAAAIPDAIRPKIGQFVRLLASDQPNEVVAAASALKRVLAGYGADLNDLGDAIASPPAPLVIYREQPASTHRPRRSPQPDQGHINWSQSYRREVRTTLEYGLAHVPFSLWEVDFISNIVDRLNNPYGRLTFRQAEVVDRLVAKIEAAY